MAETGKRRGRPRAYDPDVALEHARAAFWETGFAETSLDRLSEATAMNRPSLYGAFGDKRALYLATLQRYREESLALMRDALDPARPLRDGLATVYRRALDTYFAEPAAPRGCFLIGTATVEAVADGGIREVLGDSLRAFDAVLADRFRLAATHGEIDPDSDAETLALLASAVIHSLAVRSRAGDRRDVLERLASAAVDRLAGPAVR